MATSVASVVSHFPEAENGFTTTTAGSVSSGAVTVTLNSVAGYTNGEPVVLVIDPTDAAKKQTFTGIVDTAGVQITSVVWTAGTNQTHALGATVVDYATATHISMMSKGMKVGHEQTGAHKASLPLTTPQITTSINDSNGNEIIKTPATASAVNEITVTNAATGNPSKITATGGDANVSMIIDAQGTGVVIPELAAPQGFMVNGKIETSVATSDLTVAIKTLAGANPSATDPVYVRIGNTVRAITSALSVTKNDGTNWMDLGSASHATRDVDLFVYLGYNATDGVVIGFSRIPTARIYSDFSATTTNEKYCAISTITNAVAGDEYENIGRFNATLSAGAGYTWTIPATSIVISRPCFETRWLIYAPQWTASTTPPTLGSSTITGRYKISGDTVEVAVTASVNTGGGWAAGNGTYRFGFPISTTTTNVFYGAAVIFDAGTTDYVGRAQVGAATYAILNYVNAGVTHTTPMTPATGDNYAFSITLQVA